MVNDIMEIENIENFFFLINGCRGSVMMCKREEYLDTAWMKYSKENCDLLENCRVLQKELYYKSIEYNKYDNDIY